MDMDMKNKTCCFTGHRKIPREQLPLLSAELDAVLRDLLKTGYRIFCAGGALGFDTMAAETVLRLKREIPDIRLVLVLPCRDQTKKWKSVDIEKYEMIRSQADEVYYTGEAYKAGCMHRRNRELVDRSSVCVAYCTRDSGGSAYTVKYALRKGLHVIHLGVNDDGDSSTNTR